VTGVDANDIAREHGPDGLRAAWDVAPRLRTGDGGQINTAGGQQASPEWQASNQEGGDPAAPASSQEDPQHPGASPAAAKPPAAAAAPGCGRLLLTSSEFVDTFTPPDYLIDGLLQRRFFYSLTAPTGTGKTCIALRIAAHVALGLPLAGHEVERGKVLFFAGENPDDVRMRWIKLLEEMGIQSSIGVIWRAGGLKLSGEEIRRRIKAETDAHGPFALIVIDTSAAFFEGGDENSNVEMARHARMLRGLVDTVEGGPTVLVTCHPTKNANTDNLLPRGGGAFLAEVDGNLVCSKQPGSNVVDVHWHGKLRGPDFQPIGFAITPGTTDRLKDSKGRPIWTVTARPISEAERDAADEVGKNREGELLGVMQRMPGLSLKDLAVQLGWNSQKGEPNKTLVNRTMQALAASKLVKIKPGEHWELTKAGQAAVPRNAPF
jgi:hypothetical protein